MHTRFFNDGVEVFGWRQRLKLYGLGLIGRVRRVRVYKQVTWKWRMLPLFRWNVTLMKGWQETKPPGTLYVTWLSKTERE